MLRRALTIVIVLWLGAPYAARAEGSCASSERAFRLEISHAFSPEVRARCEASLRAALARAHVELCAGPESLPRLSITLRAGHIARIEAQDGPDIVARELETEGLPDDALGDTLAVATEELLRARWLDPAPPPAALPSPAPTAVAFEVHAPRDAPTPVPPSASQVRLGARAVAEHYGAGASLFGADLVLQLDRPHHGVRFAAGVREGTRASSAHGSVTPRSLGGELALVQPLMRRARFALELPYGLSCAFVELRAQANPGDASRTRASLAVVGWVSLAASVRLSARVRLGATTSAGYALRGASAFDEGVRVTGVAGFALRADLGLMVSLGAG